MPLRLVAVKLPLVAEGVPVAVTQRLTLAPWQTVWLWGWRGEGGRDGNGQGGDGAGDNTAGIADDDGVVSGFVGVDIAEQIGTEGAAAEVGAIKLPLVSQGDAGGGDAEAGTAALGRRSGSQRLVGDGGRPLRR